MSGNMVVLGTRPEAIKLVPVIEALRTRGAPVRVCATGQHRTLLEQALAPAGLKPDINLSAMEAGQPLSRLTARLLTGLTQVFTAERPARVLVQGDTASALAAAMAAHYLAIPVAHVEAGLRSGDKRQPWPEEYNRRAISAAADLHFAPTSRAVDTLVAEGHCPTSIHLTGNTSIDALLAMRRRIDAEPLLCRPVQPLLETLKGRRLILVTCHRRESFGPGLAEIAAALRALAMRNDVVVALPLHPNPQVGQPLESALGGLANLALLPALDHACFVKLLSAAHLVLTDSGGVQEEAPAFGKPVLILRDTTERPEGVDAGTARLVGVCAVRIVAETRRLLDDPEAYGRMAKSHSPFGDGRAAERIADLLTSTNPAAPPPR